VDLTESLAVDAAGDLPTIEALAEERMRNMPDGAAGVMAAGVAAVGVGAAAGWFFFMSKVKPDTYPGGFLKKLAIFITLLSNCANCSYKNIILLKCFPKIFVFPPVAALYLVLPLVWLRGECEPYNGNNR
jgi:hypothetical protein